MRRGRHGSGPTLIVVVILIVGIGASLGTPTLTTITVDGSMGDWVTVLSNPENVVFDGPGGGLPDADTPVPANLNLDTVAFTWDSTYLYFYVHRQATSPEFNYFWFYLDLNNDGLVPDSAPLLRIGWWGNNRRTDSSLDIYRAANVAMGDPIADGSGSHDGYRLPGTSMTGPTLESLDGGSPSGLEMEMRVSWASLGVASGTGFRFHLSTTRRLNEFPGQIRDNTGGTTAYEGVVLDPDHSISTPPDGALVLAHTLSNTGNGADTFDLSWTSSGAFAPASVIFYRDADASGTLTPGDTPLTDTDGDGVIDTGSMPGLSGPLRLLAVSAIPASASLGQVCRITLTATSSINAAVSDPAVDTVTIGGPVMTLLKAVDRAAAPPAGVLSYTITYTNTGTGDALLVDLLDPVPANTTYVSGSAMGAGMIITYSHDGGLSYDGSDAAPVTHLRWIRSAAVPPGGSGTISFQVTVN